MQKKYDITRNDWDLQKEKITKMQEDLDYVAKNINNQKNIVEVFRKSHASIQDEDKQKNSLFEEVDASMKRKVEYCFGEMWSNEYMDDHFVHKIDPLWWKKRDGDHGKYYEIGPIVKKEDYNRISNENFRKHKKVQIQRIIDNLYQKIWNKNTRWSKLLHADSNMVARVSKETYLLFLYTFLFLKLRYEELIVDYCKRRYP